MTPDTTGGTTPDAEMSAIGAPRRYRHALLFTTAASRDAGDEHFSIGGAYRFIAVPRLDLGLLIGFSARLDNVYTLEKIRSNFYLQREENQRYLVWLSVDKVQDLSSWLGVYAGLGVGHNWGEFSGTEVNPESIWTAVVDAGLSTRFSFGAPVGIAMRLGYQYADWVSSSSHWLYFAIGVRI